MRPLFTRIFLSFWVAIVLIAAGAVALTAINFAAASAQPGAVTREAEKVLQRDGLAGLRVWLAERNRNYREQRTLILDASGRDILGQRLPSFGGPRGGPGEPPPGEARFPPPPRDGGPGERSGPGPRFDEPPGARPPMAPFGGPLFFGPPGSEIRSVDGALYHVIFDPPPRRGPFSPPFSLSVRVGLMAMALAISGLISYWLARSIATPVKRLQGAAHSLSRGNLDARAGPEVAGRRDELGLLGREFDAMAERLSALIAARQRLLRDISHELRSPLARMQMAIGLARQDPASTAEQFARIERESERLDRLIGQILDYARLDRDPATFAFEPVDLVELIRQIVHDAQFESQSPPGRITFTSNDAVIIRAEPNVLHAAVDNIVRNALIHAGGQLPIEVTLTRDARELHLSVRDHGPGVPEADLSRIFEPFYRAGRLDAQHVSTDGTGIGLAITQRAAALHGGRVAARNAEGGGLIVTLTVPSADQSAEI